MFDAVDLSKVFSSSTHSLITCPFQTPKPQSLAWLGFPYGFFRQLSRCLLFKSHQCLGMSSCLMILSVSLAQLIIYRLVLNWLDHYETITFSEVGKTFLLLGKHTTDENWTDLTGLYDSYFCIVYLEWKHHASVLKSGKLWGFLWKNNKESLIKKTECSTWCP